MGYTEQLGKRAEREGGWLSGWVHMWGGSDGGWGVMEKTAY